MKRFVFLLFAAILLCGTQTLVAQTMAVKSNTLYRIAGGTLSASLEHALGDNTSLQLSTSYNPWTLANDKKIKHIAFMPELRFWPGERFKGHFFGPHLFYSHYNIGGVTMPLGLYSVLKDNRYQGDFVAVGLTYGYNWRLKNPRWSIEAEVGLGVGYASYDIYECRTCGSKIGDGSKALLAPTKVALSLVYYFGKEKQQPIEEPVIPVVVPEPEPEPQPVPEPVVPKAVELRKENPVLAHISEYRPYDKSMVLRKMKGALYVHFPLDKDDVQYDFRNNAATMDKIVEITREIMADTLSDVKIIQIVGLASIEGSVRRNEELAHSRAHALKEALQARVEAPDSLFECVGGGEAWTELRDQIEELTFEGRDELLQIIETEEDPDRREQKMRRLMGGKPYAYLRENVLSDQRNSGYVRIYYDNK